MFISCAKADHTPREYIIFQDEVLSKVETNLSNYIPRVILLVFEKWKFMATLVEGAPFCSRYKDLVKTIPVSLKIMAQAEREDWELNAEQRALHAQSLVIVKDIVEKYTISIKEAVKAKKIPKRLVTCWCAQKGLSSPVLKKWADTFPQFSEKDELKDYSALQLYDLLFNLRELYRDIVMNLRNSHPTFKAFYFVNNKNYADANKDLFNLMVYGYGWDVASL